MVLPRRRASITNTAVAFIAVLGMLAALSGCGQWQSLKPTSHTLQPQPVTVPGNNTASAALYQQHEQQTAALMKVKSNKANALIGKSTESHVESVSAVSISADAVRVSVVSHGCTSATDFQVEHVVEQGQCRLTIVRTKPDLCKRAPFVAEIEIAWSLPDACVDLPVVVANPLLLSSESETLIKRMK